VTTWTAAQVAEALGVSAPVGARAGPFGAVSTDTRRLAQGDLFVALRGERFDAHDFLEAAHAAGAGAAVIERGRAAPEGLPVFVVADTLRALGRLAHARRRSVPGPVVAITGTNGKTATKEMTAAVLGTRYRVHKTPANLNNEIGVPLTILEAPDDVEALVVEAGASVKGEIARLRDIIAPTAAIVTNVTAGHVEGFGSLEGVLEEKLSLLDGAPLAIVGSEPPALAARARRIARRVLTAGLAETTDAHADAWYLDDEAHVVLRFGGAEVRLSVPGRHQGDNAMLALALARELDLDLAPAMRALAEVRLPGGRSEVLRRGDRMVVYDAYNANPGSFAAALDTAAAMRGERPFVVLAGTMLELGSASAAEHERIAAKIVTTNPVLIGAVGEFASALEAHRATLGDRLVTAPDAEALGRAVASRVPENALVLVKASRGVHFERALPFLIPEPEAPCSTTS